MVEGGWYFLQGVFVIIVVDEEYFLFENVTYFVNFFGRVVAYFLQLFGFAVAAEVDQFVDISIVTVQKLMDFYDVVERVANPFEESISAVRGQDQFVEDLFGFESDIVEELSSVEVWVLLSAYCFFEEDGGEEHAGDEVIL